MKRKFLFNLDPELLDRAKKNYMGGRMEYANNTAFINTLLMVAAGHILKGGKYDFNGRGRLHFKGGKNERAR